MQINLDVSPVIRIVLLFLVQEQGGGGGNTCTRQIYALLFGGWGRQRALSLCLLYLSCLWLKIILMRQL